MIDYTISKQDILIAHERINNYIHHTPVISSSTLNEFSGMELYFKCENFQKVGAFKARGALNAILCLADEDRKKGVATHSSGNHAQAVAYAAGILHIPSWIVMPSTAPKVKKNAVRDYGGKIVECNPTLEDREKILQKVITETGAVPIHPYDDSRIITGQATAALEFTRQVSGLDAIVTPVGGGGLLSGTVLATRYFSSATKVYAGEPEGADDAFQSLREGKIIPSVNPNTIADGLLTSLGTLNFKIIQNGVEEIITVSDKQIVEAMRWLWERMKLVVEPSGAVPLAAVLRQPELFRGQRVGIVLSGGNVGLDTFFEQFVR